MEILLIAATKTEISPFTGNLAVPSPGAGLLTAVRHGLHNMDILVTGIGIAATAVHTTLQLARKRYDLVLNAGIAGSFNPLLPPGTVVLVSDERFGDLGVEDGDRFISFFDTRLADPDAFPYTGGRIVNPLAARMLTGAPSPPWCLFPAHGITRDRIRGGDAVNPPDADTETMEGAAFHYACAVSGTPFIQLRAISNMAGERDRSLWKTGEAISNLCGALEFILRMLPLPVDHHQSDR